MALDAKEIAQAIAAGIKILAKLPRWKKMKVEEREAVVTELAELTAKLALDIVD